MALEAERGGSLFLLVQGGRLRRRLTPALGTASRHHKGRHGHSKEILVSRQEIRVGMEFSNLLARLGSFHRICCVAIAAPPLLVAGQ